MVDSIGRAGGSACFQCFVFLLLFVFRFVKESQERFLTTPYNFPFDEWQERRNAEMQRKREKEQLKEAAEEQERVKRQRVDYDQTLHD